MENMLHKSKYEVRCSSCSALKPFIKNGLPYKNSIDSFLDMASLIIAKEADGVAGIYIGEKLSEVLRDKIQIEVTGSKLIIYSYNPKIKDGGKIYNFTEDNPSLVTTTNNIYSSTYTSLEDEIIAPISKQLERNILVYNYNVAVGDEILDLYFEFNLMADIIKIPIKNFLKYKEESKHY